MHRHDPDALPRVTWTPRGDILYTHDGTPWLIHHRRIVNGKRRKVEASVAEYRVFEHGAELRRYDLKEKERRDLDPTLLEQQLQLARPITPAPPPIDHR